MKSSKWRMPHPATMFFVLTMVVVLLSWIFEIYGLSVMLPQTGEEIRVQSLLSPEGIRWLLRHMVTNFTGFAPLGMVIVAMFGIGVAQHSGFINACIRHGIRGKQDKDKIILWVILLGLLSNVVGDAGYIILLPIAATLFHSVDLHPVAGIITAYASVACGYSANIVLSTMDPLLARTTEEAAVAGGIEHGDTGPLCNYYFMFASTFLITAVAYWVTRRKLLPAMGTYEGSTHFDGYKPLSRKERRALTMAVIVGVIYVAIVLWSTFSSYGILRGVSGNLMRSPFIMGILFLLSLGAGLMGTVYGFSSGRYRTDADVIDGLAQPMKLLGVYFVIAFFAAQMFACFEYSHLDKCLAIMGANLLSSVEFGNLPTLVLFILFSAMINLIMVSATSKWTFMAFIFVPIFAKMGVTPDVVQCAFRIGDSATNAITPFLFYMPLVLTYMQQYDKQSSYLSLLRYTWRYSVYILISWTLLFILWYLTGLPLGL
ncbi:AbgT family transporter [Bacteroides salyersiae]|uniref:AbgT family transporter n=1 Tax=Bacteroides salyersiae TaxID=291644 RepID=UPI001C027907|nr:AbgT family transporter [Bacteroides salyersiae]MBT9874194.1 AbgT family transporter [Bacteroides salyersiae]